MISLLALRHFQFRRTHHSCDCFLLFNTTARTCTSANRDSYAPFLFAMMKTACSSRAQRRKSPATGHGGAKSARKNQLVGGDGVAQSGRDAPVAGRFSRASRFSATVNASCFSKGVHCTPLWQLCMQHLRIYARFVLSPSKSFYVSVYSLHSHRQFFSRFAIELLFSYTSNLCSASTSIRPPNCCSPPKRTAAAKSFGWTPSLQSTDLLWYAMTSKREEMHGVVILLCVCACIY